MDSNENYVGDMSKLCGVEKMHEKLMAHPEVAVREWISHMRLASVRWLWLPRVMRPGSDEICRFLFEDRPELCPWVWYESHA